MHGLQIILLFIAIVGGVVSQTCDDAKLKECENLRNEAVAAAQSNQTGQCNKVVEVDECLMPCKGLTQNSPLYQRYSSLYSPLIGAIEKCKCQPVAVCLMKMSALGEQATQQERCKAYAEAKVCIQPYAEECKKDQSYVMLTQQSQTYDALCAGCDLQKLGQCTKGFENEDVGLAFTNANNFCSEMPAYQQCVQPLLPSCKEAKNPGVKQIEMYNGLNSLLCMKEKAGLTKEKTTKCFENITDDLTMNCRNTSSPPVENGLFVDETESQQCERVSKHSMCVEEVVKEECDDETTALTVRVTVSMLKIFYNNEGLECPTGGVGNMVALTWITLSSVLMALVLM